MRNRFFCLAAIGMLLSVSACQDMLETGSNRLVFDEKYNLENPDDPFYVIAGILAEVQKIGDPYVLLGELRGDLMKTGRLAPVSLQEIDRFSVGTENEFTNKSDYYNIINNCNYALQRMDTTLVVRNEKALLPAYVEIKTIRAWTYLQMGLIFGKAVYFTNPVTDLASSLAQYPVVELDALVENLVQDLRPYVNVPAIDTDHAPNPFVPVNLLLGDLYLYQNNYAEAAERYYAEILDNQLVISSDYLSRWSNSTFEAVQTMHQLAYGNEIIAGIRFSSDPKDLHSRLTGYSFNDKPFILPAENYIDFMNSAVYFHADNWGSNITAQREGDLRGNIRSKTLRMGDAYRLVGPDYNSVIKEDMYLIHKYWYISFSVYSGYDPNNDFLRLSGNGLTFPTMLPVYRHPHVYLRFAEAVNRLGKSSLAFAVLKYGMTSANMNNPAMVNPGEAGAYSFQSSNFDANIPMAARGRGYGIARDQSIFVVPDFTGNENAKQDSVQWVEDRIIDELAAETPFEGNRFFDLLCVSRRRANHPEYMAKKVAAKYADPEAMKAKLGNLDNWFLP